MTAIAQARRSKHADLRRWSPTGHHDARPNQQPAHQIKPRSAVTIITALNKNEQISRIHLLHHAARLHPIPSADQNAALKSP